MRVLVINPGSTSTKIAVFEEKNKLLDVNIEHSSADISMFKHIVDQLEFRKALILDTLNKNGFLFSSFTALSSRGGVVRHIESGTFLINDRLVDDLLNARFGEHASNLGPLISISIAKDQGVPAYIADPVTVDEMEDVARVSGLCGMERESFWHALNQKRMAKKAAKELGLPYEQSRLIVAHLGGGVSVAAHLNGRAVDVFDVSNEGCFSMDRGGSLPVQGIISLCYSGKSEKDVRQLIRRESGVYSYLKTRSFREVEERSMAGDEKAALIFNAFIYQLCKDIGSMASVLHFNVNGIILTGGMANSTKLCQMVKSSVGRLAPILIYPGEEEMEALAEGVLNVLHGTAESKVY